ncbi:hypothetical protein FQN53_001594 [Emmonsiellopsis sp. PD_33]|nr:hypothetical protein FQN53_001594 [Emmonsiellopsis sp. PD_33]
MARDLSNTRGGYGEISRVGETLGVVDPSGGGGEHQARKRVRMTPESGTEMSLPQARVPLSVDNSGHENDTFAAFSNDSLWEQESTSQGAGMNVFPQEMHQSAGQQTWSPPNRLQTPQIIGKEDNHFSDLESYVRRRLVVPIF